jgi:hypothetical protein
MLRLRDDGWAGKRRLLRLLADLEAEEWCRQTVYLNPISAVSARSLPSSGTHESLLEEIRRKVGEPETGLVLFVGQQQATVIVPPVPLVEDALFDGAETAPLTKLVETNLLIGVVLLRLGRYAVGVLRGDELVASKTGSRYVKNRHRAGGTSQHRFARSRERLVRELFDKACEVARNVFSPYQKGMNHVFLGGEQHTLRAFVQRCRHLQTLENKTLKRRLQIDRPGQVALEKIAFEVWKSRVLTFDLGGEPPLNLHLRGGEAKSLPPVGEG